MPDHRPFPLKPRRILRSIRGRLLLAAIAFTGLALLLASLSIGEVLDRFVRRGLNERLDAQIALLVRTVRDDGTIDRKMLQEIGPFTQYRRGWGWRIEAPGETITSRTVVPPVRPAARHGYDRHFGQAPNGPRTAESAGYYTRSLRKKTPKGDVAITVAAPEWLVDRMRRGIVTPLLLSLTALSAFLLMGTLLQLHIGLRPLAKLKTALADVRAGRIGRVPADQPTELAPVVTELNELLDENEAALARARGHVANLAHSLKTPLATLNLRLADTGRDPDGELAMLVGQIDHAIRHHLGRARAASPGAPGQPQLNLATVIGELCKALGRIHAERGIAVETRIAPEMSVKCDPQDLDEMLGNLLDNAWKWARSSISIGVDDEGRAVRMVIEDDGPGLSDDAIHQALMPGMRLDERGDGHGFGLSIARELAELHGGSLDLNRSPMGGLRVVLTLPA